MEAPWRPREGQCRASRRIPRNTGESGEGMRGGYPRVAHRIGMEFTLSLSGKGLDPELFLDGRFIETQRNLSMDSEGRGFPKKGPISNSLVSKIWRVSIFPEPREHQTLTQAPEVAPRVCGFMVHSRTTRESTAPWFILWMCRLRIKREERNGTVSLG